jgi:hypothetical protein
MSLPKGKNVGSSTQDGQFQGTNDSGFAPDTGAADAYVIAPNPPFQQYFTGMRITFIAKATSTGAATVNVNGLGVKSLVMGVATALSASYILAGTVVDAVYDGTNFQMMVPVAQ